MEKLRSHLLQLEIGEDISNDKSNNVGNGNRESEREKETRVGRSNPDLARETNDSAEKERLGEEEAEAEAEENNSDDDDD